MAWLRIETDFVDHPKIKRLSAEAFVIHVKGLCYCAQFLTDGFIPEAKSRELLGRFSTASRQLLDELWTRCEGGYRIHDYLHYNPSKFEALQRKEANARRQAEHRKRQKVTRDSHDPIPSHPIEEEKEKTVVVENCERERGVRGERASALQLPIHALTMRVDPQLPGGGNGSRPVKDESLQTPGMLLEAWNRLAPECRPARMITNKRAGQARQRLTERPLEGAEGWNEIICRINSSPFCTGQNDRGWKADFDFLLRPDTALHVLEGRYSASTLPSKTLGNVRAAQSFLRRFGAKEA